MTKPTQTKPVAAKTKVAATAGKPEKTVSTVKAEIAAKTTKPVKAPKTVKASEEAPKEETAVKAPKEPKEPKETPKVKKTAKAPKAAPSESAPADDAASSTEAAPKKRVSKKAKTAETTEEAPKRVVKTKASKATENPRGTKRKMEKPESVVIPDNVEVPPAPKAKLNAYTYFVAERRPVLHKEHPDWEFKELTRKVADEWKALSDDKRSEYNEQAKGDAERHDAEFALWEKACRDLGYEPSDVRKHFRDSKKKKNLPKGPKRSRTPYAFFMMTMHKTLAGDEVDFKARTQKMAAAWKAMTPEQRAPYATQAEEDKSRYETALSSFLEENPEVAKTTKRKRKHVEGEPKRAKTAYIFFTMEERAKVVAETPDMKTTEIMQDLGKRWKKIAPSKKSKFEEMAKNDSARYQAEHSAWKASQTTA